MEIKNKNYTQKFFAKETSIKDLLWPVTYLDYQGDPNKIPFWYQRTDSTTGTVDLTPPIEELFAAFKSKTRNEVKRAEKEGYVFSYNENYEAFVPYYNAFSDAKGLRENVTIDRVNKYDKTIITFVKDASANVLVMHATIVNPEEGFAMLLLSGSIRLNKDIKTSMVGWANRYCHYKEFELFKRMGVKRYEWNGVTIDPKDKERFGIGQFKQEFGGEVRCSIGLKSPMFVFIKKAQKILPRLKKINLIKTLSFRLCRYLSNKKLAKYLQQNSVYITFDDGPVPGITEFVLETLKEYNAKATFFCCGNNCDSNPYLLKRIKNEGHVIGNHTYSHVLGISMSKNEYVEEVEKGAKATGSYLFRPPWGSSTISQYFALCKKHTFIYWDETSGDTAAERFVLSEHVERLKHTDLRGKIFLFHFCKAHEKETRQILPVFLEIAKNQGLKCDSINII